MIPLRAAQTCGKRVTRRPVCLIGRRRFSSDPSFNNNPTGNPALDRMFQPDCKVFNTSSSSHHYDHVATKYMPVVAFGGMFIAYLVTVNNNVDVTYHNPERK